MNKIACILFVNLLFCNFWISYDLESSYNVNYNSGFLSEGKYEKSAVTLG